MGSKVSSWFDFLRNENIVSHGVFDPTSFPDISSPTPETNENTETNQPDAQDEQKIDEGIEKLKVEESQSTDEMVVEEKPKVASSSSVKSRFGGTGGVGTRKMDLIEKPIYCNRCP